MGSSQGSRQGNRRGGARYRTMADYMLAEVVRLRGPLMADPRAAIARALALGEVYVHARGAGGDAGLGILASRTLATHVRYMKPAKKAASRREWATARALLTDCQRAGRELAGDPAALKQELHGLFERARPSRDFEGWAAQYGWAGVTAGLLLGNARERLIAARTLLRWTRLAARRVGRGRPAPEDSPPPAKEVRQSRQAAKAPEQRFTAPSAPAASHAAQSIRRRAPP